MTTWIEKDNSLQKTFRFPSFIQALTWMLETSFAIEELDHHPEWTNVYDKVHVVLRTHDADNTITEKDRALATILDDAYDSFAD